PFGGASPFGPPLVKSAAAIEPSVSREGGEEPVHPYQMPEALAAGQGGGLGRPPAELGGFEAAFGGDDGGAVAVQHPVVGSRAGELPRSEAADHLQAVE